MLIVDHQLYVRGVSKAGSEMSSYDRLASFVLHDVIIFGKTSSLSLARKSIIVWAKHDFGSLKAQRDLRQVSFTKEFRMRRITFPGSLQPGNKIRRTAMALTYLAFSSPSNLIYCAQLTPWKKRESHVGNGLGKLSYGTFKPIQSRSIEARYIWKRKTLISARCILLRRRLKTWFTQHLRV